MEKYYIKELDVKKDEILLEKIVEHENIVFGEGSIGSWNIKPFTKYGKIYALIEMEKKGENEKKEELASVIEILSSFNRELAYIYGLSTVKKYEKKGYAKKLLEYAISEMKKLDIKKIELTVVKTNERAVNLYSKMGFTVKEELLDEYGDGEIRYLMEYEIME